jgi:hypothetical protein
MMPEPPCTATANPLGALETLEEVQSLRAENVDLKRELLDKIRGNSKFVSGYDSNFLRIYNRGLFRLSHLSRPIPGHALHI